MPIFELELLNVNVPDDNRCRRKRAAIPGQKDALQTSGWRPHLHRAVRESWKNIPSESCSSRSQVFAVRTLQQASDRGWDSSTKSVRRLKNSIRYHLYWAFLSKRRYKSHEMKFKQTLEFCRLKSDSKAWINVCGVVDFRRIYVKFFAALRRQLDKILAFEANRIVAFRNGYFLDQVSLFVGQDQSGRTYWMNLNNYNTLKNW